MLDVLEIAKKVKTILEKNGLVLIIDVDESENVQLVTGVVHHVKLRKDYQRSSSPEQLNGFVMSRNQIKKLAEIDQLFMFSFHENEFEIGIYKMNDLDKRYGM